MPICTRCHQDKPIENFNRRSDNPSRLQSWCKACKCEMVKYSKAHPRAKAPEPAYGEDVITLVDILAFGLHPAHERLRGRYHCGRKVVTVTIALDNRTEFGVWCSACDMLWRTGIECSTGAGDHRHRMVSNERLIANARAWDDELYFYIEGAA